MFSPRFLREIKKKAPKPPAAAATTETIVAAMAPFSADVTTVCGLVTSVSTSCPPKMVSNMLAKTLLLDLVFLDPLELEDGGGGETGGSKMLLISKVIYGTLQLVPALTTVMKSKTGGIGTSCAEVP